MTKYNPKDLIPHRKPMLFIDEILEASAGDEKCDGSFIHTRKVFTADNPVFKGHFPNHPILPGVFGLEALAQTGSCLVNIVCNKTAAETIFLFMAVESCKFRGGIFPDDVLEMKLSIVKRKGYVFKFEGEIFVNDKLVTEARFTAKVEIKLT